MKKANFIERKQIYYFIGLLIISLIVIGGLAYSLTHKGDNIIEDETKNYLSEISQQTSYNVNQRLDFNISTLETLSYNLKNKDVEKFNDIVNNTIDNSAFQWIGFLNQDGKLNVKGYDEKDLSHLSVVQNALKGSAGVSSHLVEVFSEESGALYVVPFQDYNNQYSAIAGWIPPDTMKLLLNTDTFNGTGFSHIVSSDGEFILHSTNENALLSGNNFFESLKKQTKGLSTTEISKMQNDFEKGKNGSIRFSLKEGGERVLNYIELNEGSWYLLSVVPPTSYSQNISNYINYSLIVLTLSVVILFLSLGSLLFWLTYKKNKEISDIAYKDPVTLGFTQTRFEIELKELIEEFQPYTFVSLDLRKFKLINDLYGSHAGDEVLKYVYHCIEENLHENEFVARINADNFNIILLTIDRDEITDRLNHIAEMINEYNHGKETPYYLPINCGSYVVKDQLTELVVIRDRANIARKSNKEMNNHILCSHVYYSDLEHEKMVKEKDMENSMEKALKEYQFVIHLQPKVSLKNGKIIGAEALVRWNNPSKGLIPPNDFIPFFEQNGFIIKLDLYVFEEVCKILRSWINNNKPVIPISVNVSRNHLYNSEFLKEYKKIQDKYQIPANLIEIELTETVVFENLKLLKNIIDEIHEYGFQCSMDDFGSGYSSLNVLKEVPVDILKLDKIFFDKENNERGNDVVDSVISLAKKLGMATVAEGIETIPQVELLRSMECDMIQGYVFSKPLNVHDFETIVSSDPVMLKIDEE